MPCRQNSREPTVQLNSDQTCCLLAFGTAGHRCTSWRIAGTRSGRSFHAKPPAKRSHLTDSWFLPVCRPAAKAQPDDWRRINREVPGDDFLSDDCPLPLLGPCRSSPSRPTLSGGMRRRWEFDSCHSSTPSQMVPRGCVMNGLIVSYIVLPFSQFA